MVWHFLGFAGVEHSSHPIFPQLVLFEGGSASLLELGWSHGALAKMLGEVGTRVESRGALEDCFRETVAPWRMRPYRRSVRAMQMLVYEVLALDRRASPYLSEVIEQRFC